MKVHTLEIKSIDSYDKDILCDYYEKIKEEKVLEVFLYADTSLANFLNFTYKQWIYICLLDEECVGFTLFNDFLGKSAFFHFCMFKKGRKFTLEFGNMIFDTVFRNEDLSTILGLTPKVYRHVFSLLESIGMKKLFSIKEACSVRGKKRDGIIIIIQKEQYYENYHKSNL